MSYSGVISEADMALDSALTGSLSLDTILTGAIVLDAAQIISDWATSIQAVPPSNTGDFSSDFSADDFAT